MTVSMAGELTAQGQFEEGTMLPKIEASVSYLERNPSGRVLITSIGTVSDALKGKNGTVITA